MKPKILAMVLAAGWLAATAYVGMVALVPQAEGFWQEWAETIARHDQSAFLAASPIDWDQINETRARQMSDERLLIGELDEDSGATRVMPKILIGPPVPERGLPEHWTPPPLRNPGAYDLG